MNKNQRMLLYYLCNWMSLFHPMGDFLLNLTYHSISSVVFACPLSEWATTDHLERCTCRVVKTPSQHRYCTQTYRYGNEIVCKCLQMFSSPTKVADCMKNKESDCLGKILYCFWLLDGLPNYFFFQIWLWASIFFITTYNWYIFLIS